MNLILYTSAETAFDSNGLGILREVMDDEVHEILNGQFELQFRYPVTGRLFRDLAPDAYVKAKPNPLSSPQPFRIYRVTKVRNGWVTVYARHLCYELRRYVCEPCTDTREVRDWFTALPAHILPPSPFAFVSDVEGYKQLKVATPVQVCKLLGSEEGCIRENIDGEYEFDGYQVMLHARRGADRGVQIRYGKNLRDLTMDQIQGTRCDAVYPFCTGEDGTIYQLPEKMVIRSDLSESNDLTVHVEDLGSVEQMMEKYHDGILIDGYGIEDIYEAMRSASLWVLLACYVAQGGYYTEPEQSLTVDFVRLSETTEYKDSGLPDAITLGDTVHVYDPELGVEASARVCEMRYQPSMERIKSITLGSVRRSLARTIAARTTPAKQTIKVDPSVAAAANLL